jgi:geranylgeranyl diphosphate synthase, type II
MQSFEQLSQEFKAFFSVQQFPNAPASLYEPNEYFLQLGGKRVRPIAVLMGNELFGGIKQDAFYAGAAIELFHNFSLIHDDVMDNAPLRRSQPTIHEKYGLNTAILSGDVMFVKSYEYLAQLNAAYLKPVLQLFNTTARQVCEGQQLDMDFSTQPIVQLEQYIEMIALKTSVLIAAAFAMGGMIGEASQNNVQHLYSFGKNLGIAFQIQDDYLDAFGKPELVGKKPGGDIEENKQTFLQLYALQNASAADKQILQTAPQLTGEEKLQNVLGVFERSGAKDWTLSLKNTYFQKAMEALENVAVLSNRKQPITDLANFLIERDY